MTHEWSKDEAQIIKAAWATEPGRLALNLIVERLAGLMSPSFDQNALTMAHNEGRRSIGVDLMRAINMPIHAIVKEPHEPRSNRPLSATERLASAEQQRTRAATDAAVRGQSTGL